MADESPVQTDAKHRKWAHEHLMYEVNTLVAATDAIKRLSDGSTEMAFALESWAVHTRCLLEFLWHDRGRHPGDAFATDFCKPGEWKSIRGALPPTLSQIVQENRVGREVAHLTYHRSAVKPEKKVWTNGKGTIEIVTQLHRLAEIARPERLAGETRDHMRKLHGGLDLGSNSLGQVSGATGSMIRTTGGTQPYPGFSGDDVT